LVVSLFLWQCSHAQSMLASHCWWLCMSQKPSNRSPPLLPCLLKFGLWWVLWVRVWPWLLHASKMFKLHTNQLVIWFVQGCASNWCLSLFLVPS
jgi:hypothetical protein